MLVHSDLNEVYIQRHMFYTRLHITMQVAKCKLFTKATINFTMNNKRNSLSMSVTDKRSYVYIIDNTSQGIFHRIVQCIKKIGTPLNPSKTLIVLKLSKISQENSFQEQVIINYMRLSFRLQKLPSLIERSSDLTYEK